MDTTTIAGPFKSRAQADETAAYLGDANHSVYSNALEAWYVERHNDIASALIFGMTWGQIQAKQQKE